MKTFPTAADSEMGGRVSLDRLEHCYGTESRSRELALRRSPRLLGISGLRRSHRLLEKSAMMGPKRTTPHKPCKKFLAKVSVGRNTKKVYKAVSSKKKSKSTIKHLLNKFKSIWGRGMKAVSYTSIVGMITKSFALLGIDSRLVADGYLSVLSNRYPKVINWTNGVAADDVRFRNVCAAFSGGNKLQAELSENLPENLKDKLYPINIATWIREKLEEKEKLDKKEKPGQRDSGNNQVIVMGVSETNALEMYSVASASISNDAKRSVSSASTLPTIDKIDGFCIAGSGVKWMKPVLCEKYQSSDQLPIGITSVKAKEDAFEALIVAAKNDVPTGGFLQTITISNEGTWGQFFKYQLDFDDSNMGFIDWPHGKDPVYDV